MTLHFEHIQGKPACCPDCNSELVRINSMHHYCECAEWSERRTIFKVNKILVNQIKGYERIKNIAK